MADRLRPATVGAAGAGLALALPLAALAVQAFADEWRFPALPPQRIGLRGLHAALAAGGGGTAMLESAVVALAATVLALLLGWPAARALGERRIRRSGPLVLLLALPVLVPGYATGTGLAAWLVRLGLADTTLGLVAAHLVVVLPYVVLTLVPGFGPELHRAEEMARSLGAGHGRRLLLVSAPALRRQLATAVLLGALVSWSQYGLSLAVGGGIPTLPLVLLPFVRNDPEVAAALSLFLLAPALLALVASARTGAPAAGSGMHRL